MPRGGSNIMPPASMVLPRPSMHDKKPARGAGFFISKIVIGDTSVFIALDDLIHAVTSAHTQLADCGRVIERIRRIIAPALDGGEAWHEMHKALNVSQPYQEWITKKSTGSRHGDSEYVPPEICTEVLQRTWVILNRFFEYRKRGNQPLMAAEFPNL